MKVEQYSAEAESAKLGSVYKASVSGPEMGTGYSLNKELNISSISIIKNYL